MKFFNMLINLFSPVPASPAPLSLLDRDVVIDPPCPAACAEVTKTPAPRKARKKAKAKKQIKKKPGKK